MGEGEGEGIFFLGGKEDKGNEGRKIDGLHS
jgi:hypothetical protein